jgi:hypothetical protein
MNTRQEKLVHNYTPIIIFDDFHTLLQTLPQDPAKQQNKRTHYIKLDLNNQEKNGAGARRGAILANR